MDWLAWPFLLFGEWLRASEEDVPALRCDEAVIALDTRCDQIREDKLVGFEEASTDVGVDVLRNRIDQVVKALFQFFALL